MKLTDTNKLRDYVKEQINPYGKPFEGSAYEFGLKIMHYIDNTSTDYDVDKVVEKLEELRKKDVCDYLYCDVCAYTDKCSGVTDQSNNLKWDKAIEIVKQGCVSDDVCQWNGEQSRLVTFTRFTTACGDNIDLQTNSELLKAFRYCPFCGKKIKIVGD